MGYTQFLPTDFEKYGVDFDGDGKRDIWSTVPDALASAGNSLHSQGWDGAQTWAYEVTLPADFDCTLQGPDKARPICEWMKLGVARVKDRPFPEERLGDQAFLVLPAGLKGPAFLATNNFSVLKLYNNSDVYAIFVGHVADMIAANAPAAFRRRLAAGRAVPARPHPALPGGAGGQGYDVGKVDGLAGFKTRARHRRRGTEARPATDLLSEQRAGRCSAEGGERGGRLAAQIAALTCLGFARHAC